MSFIGLDLSISGTGFCFLRGADINPETIKTTPKGFEDDLARLRHISNEIMKRIPQDVMLICLEDFYTPTKIYQAGAAIKLAMLGAVVRMELKEAGRPFIIPTANQIKKFATGKGNAPKSVVLMAVYKRWGLECKDDNQADATVMAVLARAVYNQQVDPSLNENLTKPQLEVVQKVLEERPRYNWVASSYQDFVDE